MVAALLSLNVSNAKVKAMSDTIIASIIGGVFTIIAAVIGAWYSYKRSQRQMPLLEGHKDAIQSKQQRLDDAIDEPEDERIIHNLGQRIVASPKAVDLLIAQDLVEKVKDSQEQPDTILAVQTEGLWVAEFLREKLEYGCRIISVEKEVEEGRLAEYRKINRKGASKRNDFYIAHKELTNSRLGNVVIVDDFVGTGETVLSIIDGLDCNIKTVATIAVDKSHIDKVQCALQQRDVQLIRVATGGEDIYRFNRQHH